MYKINMYSILKSEKKELKHGKAESVTGGIFLNNHHLLFTFQDGTFIISNLASEILGEGKVGSSIIDICAVGIDRCIVLDKECNLYGIEWNSGDRKAKHLSMPAGSWTKVMKDSEEGLKTSVGQHMEMYGFEDGKFVFGHRVEEDRKIVLECYSSMEKEPVTVQYDLQMDGNYCLDRCYTEHAEFALYKEQSANQTIWEVKLLTPFEEGNVRMALPEDIWNEDTQLKQVCRWLDDKYLLIILQPPTWTLYYAIFVMGKWVFQPGPSMHFLHPSMHSLHSPQLHSIFYHHSNTRTFYALGYAHQRIQQELYENWVVVGNMETGGLVERGFCSLKRTGLSPNGQYILDMPQQMQALPTYFYHIRSLLSKSCLYLFLIQQSELNSLTEGLKQIILSVL